MTTPADDILYEELRRKFPAPAFEIDRHGGYIFGGLAGNVMHADASASIIEAMLLDDLARQRAIAARPASLAWLGTDTS